MRELESLRSFFMPAVEKCVPNLVKKVVTREQLEILSSISSVVVCAYYIDGIKINTVEPLNTLFHEVHSITTRFGGIITKLDYTAGLNFCVQFGSLGFKHHDDGPRSLEWARCIIEEMKEFGCDGVVRICTGMCFSGVIGPPHRVECCLIGKPVFSTVMLIHRFLDVPIICDSNTALRCRRDFGDFFTLISKRSSGLKNIPVCFAVNFSARRKISVATCIGRDVEKEIIFKALKELKNPKTPLGDKLPFIPVKGQIGTGKTTYLKYVLGEASRVGIKLTCFVDIFPYEETDEKAWYIIKKILSDNGADNENGIIELLGSKYEKYPLHLLNKHFDTKFQKQNEYSEALLMEMVVTLLKECSQNRPILIAIDDGEHIARQTAYFLLDLLTSRTAIIIMSFTEPFSLESKYIEQLLAKSYETIVFQPLSEDAIATLACHFLNIIAIHNDFWSFLCKNSKGNALRLQEILLLPQLQHHLCFVEYGSIVPWKFEESFYQPENLIATDEDNAKVCDIMDPEGLLSVYVPEHLLDVVKEHTNGLTPEEQMLIKKCAILGENFSLYILEGVCPEYTTADLHNSVAKLVRKNLLTFDCHHFELDENGFHQHSETDLTNAYCFHLIKFVSGFLQQCVVNFMQSGQKERIHLFIVSLLKDVTITCDACRFHTGEFTLPMNEYVPWSTTIPCFNLFACHCRDFQITVYERIDQHLKYSNAPTERRVVFLLKAAAVALQAEKDSLASNFLDAAEQLINSVEGAFSHPELARAVLGRLQAEKYYFLGEINEAMDAITQAMSYLGRNFPTHYLRKHVFYNSVKTDFQKEESRCLAVGCTLLIKESRFEEAFLVAKSHKKLIEKFYSGSAEETFPSCTDLLKQDCLLLCAGAKARQRKVKYRTNKYRQALMDRCHNMLTSPDLNTKSLEAVISAMVNITMVFFERNELAIAEVIGFRVLQICKISNGLKQITVAIPILYFIYYYLNDAGKSFQILSGLLDITVASDDTMSEAMYYSLIMKLLMRKENNELRQDKIVMCTTFATSKCDQPLRSGDVEKKFWITSMMSEWCFEQKLMDAFSAWYKMARELKSKILLINHWSLVSELRMATLDVLKLKNNADRLKLSELNEKLAIVKANIDDIEKLIKRYAPVALSEVKSTRRFISKIWHKRSVMGNRGSVRSTH